MLFLFLLSTLAFAAPVPMTSSSMLISSKKGLFFSEYGFSINADGTSWNHHLPPKRNKYVITEYRHPHIRYGVQEALTIRVDKTKKSGTLKSYMKKWMKDYPRFGFQILDSKPIKVKGQLAYMLDLINKDNKRQIRQVVFLKDQNAVILTCRGHRQVFKKTVKSCNQIIRNFSWIN